MMLTRKPFVKGIAAVDSNNNICFSAKNENKWKTIGRFYNNELTTLDFTLLRETVRAAKENDAVFVMGENVATDMRRYFEGVTRLVVSTPNDSTSDITARAFREAYRDKTPDNPRPILVLGGVTVYTCFQELYDAFVLTKFVGSPNTQKYKTKTIDTLYNDKLLPMGGNNIYCSHDGNIVEYVRQ